MSGFGLGAEVGHPTGFTLKSFVSDQLAIDGGLGVGLFRGTGLHVYGDVLFTAAQLSPDIGLYLGGGLRIWDHHYDPVSRYDYGRDTHVGVRVPIGLSIHVHGSPLEIFIQAGVVFDLRSGKGCSVYSPTQTTAFCRSDGPVDALANFGLRYYFGRKR